MLDLVHEFQQKWGMARADNELKVEDAKKHAWKKEGDESDLSAFFRAFKESTRGVPEQPVVPEQAAEVPRPEELRQRRASFLERTESSPLPMDEANPDPNPFEDAADPAEFEPLPEDFVEEESTDDEDSESEQEDDVELLKVAEPRVSAEEMARRGRELDGYMAEIAAAGNDEEEDKPPVPKRQRVSTPVAKEAPKAKAKAKAKANPVPAPAAPAHTLSLPEGVVSELHKMRVGGTYTVVFYGGAFPGTPRTVTVRSMDARYVWVVPAGKDGEVNRYSKHLVGQVTEADGPLTRSRARRQA